MGGENMQFDLKNFDPRKIDFTKIDLKKFDLKKFDLKNLNFDLKKIDLKKVNFNYKNIKFEKNLGRLDQIVRYAIGSILLLYAIFTGKIIPLLLGVALVASAYVTWCPAYSGFSMNTCDK